MSDHVTSATLVSCCAPSKVFVKLAGAQDATFVVDLKIAQKSSLDTLLKHLKDLLQKQGSGLVLPT